MKNIKLNDICELEQYDNFRDFAEKNHYQIIEIEPTTDKGKIIRHFQIKEKEIVLATYKELRRQEYPSVLEQLDMIYWDKINGTSKWLDIIRSIKEKYPKE